MATRATEAEVKEIIDTEITEEGIAPFLVVANRLTTNVCGDEDYDASTLRDIELYLAAHLVAVRDPRLAAEKIGAAGATYHGKSGMGLEHTPYGQQAMILDYKGKLKEMMESKRSAEIKVIA